MVRVNDSSLEEDQVNQVMTNCHGKPIPHYRRRNSMVRVNLFLTGGGVIVWLE